MKISIPVWIFLVAGALALQNCQSIPEKINHRPPTTLDEAAEPYFDKLLAMTSVVEDQSRDIHDFFADDLDDENIKLANFNPQHESGFEMIAFHRESGFSENDSEESLKNARLEIQKYKLLPADRKHELKNLVIQAKEREAKLKTQIHQGNLMIRRLRQKIAEK